MFLMFVFVFKIGMMKCYKLSFDFVFFHPDQFFKLLFFHMFPKTFVQVICLFICLFDLGVY